MPSVERSSTMPKTTPRTKHVLVMAYFRSTGVGSQARVDGVLTDYVAKHGFRRAKRAA
jgi:uncharacterized protein (DUF4415 family)